MRFITIALILIAAHEVSAQGTPIPPYPNGMRLIVATGGSIPRNGPWGTCGTDNHPCGAADSQVANTYAFVLPDAPVLDTGGLFYWIRVTYDTGPTGWSRSDPMFLMALTPNQMIAGISFNVAASYDGASLTQAVCINDGANSPANMQLQPFTLPDGVTPGQRGTLLCPWPKAGIGNHKVVIKAVNGQGTADSSEFQFAVTTAPIPQPPAAPTNVRIR